MVQDILESIGAQRVLRLASRDECLKTSGELRGRFHACGPQVAIMAFIATMRFSLKNYSLSALDKCKWPKL